MLIDFYQIRNFSDVAEFHSIMPIDNVPLVIIHGILSNEKVSEFEHKDVSMQEVQERRDIKTVPGGLKLHQYANLYFHARNPMMYYRQNEDVCILRIDKSVANIQGVVFSDRNASSNWVSFYSLSELSELDFNSIFCKDWNDEDEKIKWMKKSKKCAEVLVPHSISYQYIIGAYVKNDMDKQKLIDRGFERQIDIYRELFFK